MAESEGLSLAAWANGDEHKQVRAIGGVNFQG